jgi:predicted Fe-Mo cluster-binding NifX family protein
MKAAFAAWEDRIAPVFDVARRVRLVDARGGRILGECERPLDAELPTQRVWLLAEMGIELLVCGAISRPMEAMVAAHGIRVVPFVTGGLREIIDAWLEGRIGDRRHVMPGCRCRRARAHGRKEVTVRGQGSGGGRTRGRGQNGGGKRQAGRGPGRGGGQRRTGRMSGPFAAGPQGRCVCARCGHEEPHRRGAPCIRQRCPECGAVMRRAPER